MKMMINIYRQLYILNLRSIDNFLSPPISDSSLCIFSPLLLNSQSPFLYPKASPTPLRTIVALNLSTLSMISRFGSIYKWLQSVSYILKIKQEKIDQIVSALLCSLYNNCERGF